MLNRITLSAILAIAAAMLLAPAVVRCDDAKPGPIKSLPWLHEGLQITFFDRFSTTLGTVNGFREPKDLLLIPAAGKGHSQITVARIDGDKIVLAQRAFLDRPGAAPAMVPEMGGVGPATKMLVGVHPWVERETLAMYLKTPAQGITTFTGKFKMGDKTVDSVTVKSEGQGSLTYFIYDADTGLLLNRSSQMLVPGLKATTGGGLVNRTDTNIQLRDFVSIRDVKIPWANEPAPKWIGTVKALHYSETMEMRNGNFPPIFIHRRQDITVTDRGDGWLKADIDRVVLDPGAIKIRIAKQTIAWGNTQFDGLWAGPAALATLREGQVLDEDPNTGVKTLVSKVDDKFVTITVMNPAAEIDSQYEKHSGTLVFTRHLSANPWTQTTCQLLGSE